MAAPLWYHELAGPVRRGECLDKDLPPVRVMFVAELASSPSAIPAASQAAFKRLEQPLGSLKGRRFYGAILPGEYRACVTFTDHEEPRRHGFSVWDIPGGRYACAKVKGWDRPGAIPEAFRSLCQGLAHDASRPELEFYRSHGEAVVMVPVLHESSVARL